VKGLDKDFGLDRNRPFYIVSRLPMERVVDVTQGNYLYLRRMKHDYIKQQFFFDPVTKTIKSQQWKDKSLDQRSSGYLYKTDARWYQLWRYDGQYFVNEKGQHLTVQSNIDAENRRVIPQNKNNWEGMKWDVTYADEVKPEPKKGEFSPKFGFYVERPFHFVSS